LTTLALLFRPVAALLLTALLSACLRLTGLPLLALLILLTLAGLGLLGFLALLRLSGLALLVLLALAGFALLRDGCLIRWLLTVLFILGLRLLTRLLRRAGLRLSLALLLILLRWRLRSGRLLLL